MRDIATKLKRFIEVCAAPFPQLRAVYRLYLQDKKSTAIDPAHARYQVGQGGIELRHIQIASLEQVTRYSWQPRLILNDL